MRQVALVLASLLVGPVPGVAQAPKLDVPITVGGKVDLDACGTVGEVYHLDPNGDNFLSVQSGPGGKPYRELDRLHTGTLVLICENRGNWLGVLYQRHGEDCGTGTPIPREQVYKGPCAAGWVHHNYVHVLAG